MFTIHSFLDATIKYSTWIDGQYLTIEESIALLYLSVPKQTAKSRTHIPPPSNHKDGHSHSAGEQDYAVGRTEEVCITK